MHGDDFGDAACGDAQGVVGFLEGREDVELGVDFAEALVVDDEQGIDVLRYLLYAVEGLVNLLVALEDKGYGDDAHGQNAHAFGLACHDGCGTGACATAHAGGDEDHLGAIVEHAAYVLYALFGGLSGAFGSVAGAKALLAQLQAGGDG